MKKLVCIHGWMGSPNRNWWPWLIEEAKKLGMEVVAPQFPATKNPNLPQWIKILKELLGGKTDDVILIGHSLGCDAILRYAESIPRDQKIAGAIMVAPFFDEKDMCDLKDFNGKTVDIQRVKSTIMQRAAIFSTNDPHVPLSEGMMYQQRLESKIIVLKNRGHFTQEDKVLELPEVLRELKNMLETK